MSGCWGKYELNEIAIVSATGIDLEPDGRTRITVIAVLPVGNPEISGIERSNAWVGTAVGENITDAENNLLSIAPQTPVFYHDKILIIGEQLARAGVEDVMDYLLRGRSIRTLSYFMISEGRAYDLLLTPADIQKNLPKEIEGIIRNTNNNYKSWTSTLKDFLVCRSKKGCEPVVGRISTKKITRNTFSTFMENERKLNDNIEKEIASVDGCAVFCGEKFKGFLNQQETKGYNWIKNKPKSGIVTVRDKSGEINIGAVIKNFKCSLKPEITDGRIVVTIKYRTNECSIRQKRGDEDIGKSQKADIESILARVVTEEMKAAVYKAQKVYNADIFGIGQSIYRKYPNVWDKIESEWNKIYPMVETKYDVKVEIERMGEIVTTMND